MATHSSVLAWKIPWTEETWDRQNPMAGYRPWGLKESDPTEATTLARAHKHTHTLLINNEKSKC